jgi:hypothetical protein
MGMLIAAGVLSAACRDRAPQGAQEPVKLDSVPRRVEVRLYVATWPATGRGTRTTPCA